jgi:hypothetical protein
MNSSTDRILNFVRGDPWVVSDRHPQGQRHGRE